MATGPDTKFLVVDDFSTMRRIVRNLLKELGFIKVEEAEDGVMALQKLRGRNFDFVVTDWNMPNMNGFELIRAMRAEPALAKVPVLLVVGRKEAAERTVSIRRLGREGQQVMPLDAALTMLADEAMPPDVKRMRKVA